MFGYDATSSGEGSRMLDADVLIHHCQQGYASRRHPDTAIAEKWFAVAAAVDAAPASTLPTAVMKVGVCGVALGYTRMWGTC
jgi:hypothetical protein